MTSYFRDFRDLYLFAESVYQWTTGQLLGQLQCVQWTAKDK